MAPSRLGCGPSSPRTEQPSPSGTPRAEFGPRVAHGLAVAVAGAALATVLVGPGFVSLRAVHGLLEALVHLLS